MIYKIFASPSGSRAFRKLAREVQNYIRGEIGSLATNPTKGERMKGEIRFLHSLHMAFSGVQYRFIYEIDEREKEIYIHYPVKSFGE